MNLILNSIKAEMMAAIYMSMISVTSFFVEALCLGVSSWVLGDLAVEGVECLLDLEDLNVLLLYHRNILSFNLVKPLIKLFNQFNLGLVNGFNDVGCLFVGGREHGLGMDNVFLALEVLFHLK